MRKHEKERCLEMIETLFVAHEEIRRDLEYENEAGASELLSQCQQAAISVGEFIENIEENEVATEIVKILEVYCERAFLCHEIITTPDENRVYSKVANEVCSELNHYLTIAKQKIASLSEKIEVVFFPYKSSMWDSLESVWIAANNDPNCSAFVVPIPYFDRNADGTLGKMHYEGTEFEENIPIVSYKTYDVKTKRPDMIFIHNPFDEGNHATSVHPFYYSKNLKQYTDHLVYIPYFISSISDERCKNDPFVMKGNVDNAATIHAHHIIQQSEAMAQACIEVMTSIAGEETRQYWEDKFLGIGSPKVDKLLRVYNEGVQIPSEWKSWLDSEKKVVLYNSGVMAMLSGDCKAWIKKTKDDLALLQKSGMTIIWRPHPLLVATFDAMRPDNSEEYINLIKWFQTNHIGILDESSDVDRSIALCDVFTGDFSSIEVLCKLIYVPVIYNVKDIIKFAEINTIRKKERTPIVIKEGSIGRDIYNSIYNKLTDT